jgi:hypothetical protein
MENSRTIKKVLDIRPEGTRTIGGPKLRWEGPSSGELEEHRELAEASEQDHGPHRTV